MLLNPVSASCMDDIAHIANVGGTAGAPGGASLKAVHSAPGSAVAKPRHADGKYRTRRSGRGPRPQSEQDLLGLRHWG